MTGEKITPHGFAGSDASRALFEILGVSESVLAPLHPPKNLVPSRIKANHVNKTGNLETPIETNGLIVGNSLFGLVDKDATFARWDSRKMLRRNGGVEAAPGIRRVTTLF